MIKYHPPADNKPSRSTPESTHAIGWQEYCIKVQEVEHLKKMLKECEILLTQGTEEHCINMAFEIEMYFREEEQ